jgi:ArsR family transcriptional regulator
MRPIATVPARELALVFDALAHPTRLVLLSLIDPDAEACVCDLATESGLPEEVVLHELSGLVAAGVLETRLGGPWVYYRIAVRMRTHIERLLDTHS